jgi:hypothetical protein
MCSPDHGESSAGETGSNPPDGSETDTMLSQEGVNTEIEDRDEDLKQRSEFSCARRPTHG